MPAKNAQSVPTDTCVGGYLSQEHKRKFTITVGILGAVFFIAQFIVPFAVMMIAMPFMSFSMKEVQPQFGTQWDHAIWYLERAIVPGRAATSSARLKKIDLAGKKGPEAVCSLPMLEPWLLAGDDRLWIIASSAVGHYQDGDPNIVPISRPLGDISKPFLHHGLPAVVQATPAGLSLMVFDENRWQKECAVDLKTQKTPTDIKRNLQVLSDGEKLHFFLRHGDTLYYTFGYTVRRPAATQQVHVPWETVARVANGWQSLLIDGEPAAFYSRWADSRNEIIGLKYSAARWSVFFSRRVPGVQDMGVYPLPQSGRFAVLTRSFPGSIRLLVVEGTQIVSTNRYDAGFPFSRAFASAIFIPQGITLCMPLILAVILSALMRKHRKCQYEVESLAMPFASLARRAAAQIIDALFLGGPVLAGYVLLMFPVFGVEEMFISTPLFPFAAFGLVFGGLFWVLVCLFLFSFSEGKWGGTPGKWILGIRVLGADLHPCGFGRALIRNLLKFVDGFFNFLVGVLIVALTENWQRVGDMAARTVVVHVRKKGGEVSAGSSAQSEQW